MSIGQLSAQQISALTGGGNGLSGLNISGAGSWSRMDEINHMGGKGMSIRIVPATGGTIISIKDESKMSDYSNLYVISDSQNIAEEIGKIITLHYLKS